VTENLENFCELNKAQNKARSRLTKNVWPYPLSSWGEKITSQTKGKDQTKGRRSRSSKAPVCLFVFSADADSHALASRTLHWQMPARVWKVDRGIFLAIGRTSDSQTQPPHVLVEQRKKKREGDSNRVGTWKWTEMCAPGCATCWQWCALRSLHPFPDQPIVLLPSISFGFINNLLNSVDLSLTCTLSALSRKLFWFFLNTY
jgi:hypothetical protein